MSLLSRQRQFESKQTSYREVLQHKKKNRGLEIDMSKLDYHTVDPVKYKTFPRSKRQMSSSAR